MFKQYLRLCYKQQITHAIVVKKPQWYSREHVSKILTLKQKQRNYILLGLFGKRKCIIAQYLTKKIAIYLSYFTEKIKRETDNVKKELTQES